jgi:hypothetical protein
LGTLNYTKSEVDALILEYAKLSNISHDFIAAASWASRQGY